MFTALVPRLDSGILGASKPYTWYVYRLTYPLPASFHYMGNRGNVFCLAMQAQSFL